MEKRNELTTKELLELDPIDLTERLLETPSEEWDPGVEGMVSLAITSHIADLQRTKLAAMGDTHFGTKWAEFLQIAESLGFEYGLRLPFTGRTFSGNPIVEEEVILFHESGIIIHAESFGTTDMNIATMYLEVEQPETLSSSQRDALSQCSFSFDEDRIQIKVDIRQGFKFHFNAIASEFIICNKWKKVPFLWFLNYMETHDKADDHEVITKHKIHLSCQRIQEIIGMK